MDNYLVALVDPTFVAPTGAMFEDPTPKGYLEAVKQGKIRPVQESLF